MTVDELRAKYPKFVYQSFHWEIINKLLHLTFKYQTPPDHNFTHTLVYENIDLTDTAFLDLLAFHIGLAAMPSYWKATCSPVIEIQAGYLDDKFLPFWVKLFEKGMGEYYFKNRIDFTTPDFLTIRNAKIKANRSASRTPATTRQSEHLESPESSGQKKVLIPIGGGKDSAVTAEIFRQHFPINCFIVNPIPASMSIAKLSGCDNPVVVRRTIDPYLLKLNNEGYLNGHIPFSSSVAFLSLLAAVIGGYRYIALSNERSSNEGNAVYLDHTVNHQYSKTLEFETDFNNYIHNLTANYQLPTTNYFSFLRPLYELQIGRIFSRMPQYFSVFRSCNVGQKTGIWCNHCSKCLSIALVLAPWVSPKQIVEIFGRNPLTDTANKTLLKNMITPGKKPFECVTTTAEAKLALEIIRTGFVPQHGSLLQEWLENPNLPPEISAILQQEYARCR